LKTVFLFDAQGWKRRVRGIRERDCRRFGNQHISGASSRKFLSLVAVSELLFSSSFFPFFPFFFEERYDPSFTPYDLRLGCYGRNDMALLMTSDDARYYEFMFRVFILWLYFIFI